MKGKSICLKIRGIAAIVFLFGVTVSFCVTWNVYRVQCEQRHALVQSIANSRTNLFLQALEERISVSNTMEALVFDDEGKKTDLERISEEIYRDTYPTITSFGLAPEGTVSYIYPSDSHEYIGKNLLVSDDSVGLTYASMSQRNYIVLKDGQVEIYNPVYLREKDTGYQEFWGFVMVSGPIRSILKDGRITELNENGYYYSLKVQSSYNRSEKILACDSDMKQIKNAETYTATEPGYKFTLTIAPKEGWCDRVTIFLTAGLCGVLTILITALTVTLMKQRQSNELLDQISSQDRLTGLPNSRSFGTTTDLLRKQGKNFTLFFLDANNFKHVNDTYGHETGNEVLCEYGIRLQEVFPNQVYRLGGDEFAAIVSETLKPEEAESYIQKINRVLDQTYELNGNEISLSMSAGWALSGDSTDNEAILNQADQMMYRNKQKYHQEMHENR